MNKLLLTLLITSSGPAFAGVTTWVMVSDKACSALYDENFNKLTKQYTGMALSDNQKDKTVNYFGWSVSQFAGAGEFKTKTLYCMDMNIAKTPQVKFKDGTTIDSITSPGDIAARKWDDCSLNGGRSWILNGDRKSYDLGSGERGDFIRNITFSPTLSQQFNFYADNTCWLQSTAQANIEIINYDTLPMNGVFKIKNKHSQYYAYNRYGSSAGYNAPVIQERYWAGHGEWRLEVVGNTSYKIVSPRTSKLMAAALVDGNNVVVMSAPDGQNEGIWRFERAGNGYYKIRMANSNKLLTARSCSTDNDIWLTVDADSPNNNCNGDNQLWRLDPVTPRVDVSKSGVLPW